MHLRTWDPFQQFNNLGGVIDELFDQAAIANHRLGGSTADIYKEKGNYVVEVTLPSFKKDEVDVQMSDGYIEIKAERKSEDEHKERQYIRRESSMQTYHRRVVLPSEAWSDKATAHFENGILKVVVPMKELPKPKKLAIDSGDGKK